MFPEVGVVSLVPERWSNQWQLRHQVLTRLSRYYNVVWVNPASQLLQRSQPRHEIDELELDRYPGFIVYEPEPWLPIVHHPFLGDFTFRQRLKRAGDLLVRRGVSKRVLYIWRPEFARALDLAHYDISCYHIDDEYSFCEVETPIPEAEVRLLTDVTQVFIHSPGLMERKGRFNPHTAMIPNGADFQAYSQAVPEPSDMVSIPHPRVGYTGWLKKHLDWKLLLQLSDRHPDISFVFVGPVSPHREVLEPIEQLKRRSNVFMLGSKSTQALASYPQHFDVCIMPYAAVEYTRYIYPLKLHEYLAAGKPTVGTRIRSLEDFPGFVSLAMTPDEWSAAIVEALQPEANTPKRIRERQAVARQHDWESIVWRVASAIGDRLGPEYTERLQVMNESSLLAKTTP